MNPTTIGLDIAKNVFQAYGVDQNGKVGVRKRLSRAKVLEFFANLNLPRCLIGMEACPGAHYCDAARQGGSRVYRLREYQREFRENLGTLERVLVKTPMGAHVPLRQLADITLTTGPAMIRDENAQLAGYVYLDTSTRDIGGYVDSARRAIEWSRTR